MRCILFLFYETIENIETKVFVSVFMFFVHAPIPEDSEEQLNLVLPGCLLPYQKEIKKLFFFGKAEISMQ